ncbi:MAG TPA: sigma factor-like helix-turn-helix DNA-binding protein, partial [Chitinophagaceae bacterium]|nr:sigma factor-like helix-turn-helix DNA-binding protein [Chitinophagaceae bacterium]
KQGKMTVEITDRFNGPEEETTDHRALQQDDLTYDLMSAALKELNPEQQQCVTLFYLQKKSYQEVSEATGFSMLQVKSYIQNGKRNLKILIEKKLEAKQKKQ